MPRQPQGWWRKSHGAYYATVRGQMERLNYPDGSPVVEGDLEGKLRALAELVGRPAPTPSRAVAGLTVERLAQAYLDARKADGAKPRTLADHRDALNRFGSHRGPGKLPIGLRLAESIGSADWSHYRAALEGLGLAPRTIERHLESIKACWRWAARPVERRKPTRLLKADPFHDLLVTFRPRRVLIRGVLSPGQVSALIAASEAEPEVFRLLLRVQAESGCRSGEVRALKWEHWTGRAWVIPHTEHKTGEVTGRKRVIGVTAATAALIDDYRQRARPGPWCWSVRRSGHVSELWQRQHFRRCVERARAAGVELPPDVGAYWLRTSSVAHSRRAAIDAVESAAVRGHSARVALDFYDSIDEDDAARVAERLAGWRSGGD